jgi:hypothetical protein
VSEDEVIAPGAGGTERLPWVGRAVPSQPPGARAGAAQSGRDAGAAGFGEPVDPFWPPVHADPSFDAIYPVQAPAPPRRRRVGRTILITIGAVLSLCCAGGIAIALIGPHLTGPVATTAGLNTSVRDGKFEFAVSSVSCGHPSVSHRVSTAWSR